MPCGDVGLRCANPTYGLLIAKDFDSPGKPELVSCAHSPRRTTMNTRTCAACDDPLDGNAIQVKIGNRVVEVCCEECAQKLREASQEKSS
jgi:hypothetical protein